jgi:hypothetical protein
MSNEELRVEDFVGTWKLVSVHRTIIENGETVDTHEPDHPPSGVLMYGSDGRMIVLNLAGWRPKPDGAETMTDDQRNQLFRTMLFTPELTPSTVTPCPITSISLGTKFGLAQRRSAP